MSSKELKGRNSMSVESLTISKDRDDWALEEKPKTCLPFMKRETKGDLQIERGKRIENECKICLVKEKDMNLLVSLCSCSGSLKYTHLTCLNLWINQQIKTSSGLNKIRKQGITCQICMNVLNLKRTRATRCIKSAEFYQTLCSCDAICIIALVLMIACICLVAAGAVLINIQTGGVIITIMVVGMIGVGAIVLLIVGVYFVKKFLIVRTITYDPN